MAVLFISDKLLDPSYRELMRLPLDFICFATVDGKLYTTEFGKNTFVAQGTRKHGNNKVYGALYVLSNPDYHLRTLDSHYLCSMSALHKNHNLDTMHRVVGRATPIRFSTLEELDRLMYEEMEEIDVQMYVGNLNNPKVKRRVEQKVNWNFRVMNGVNKNLIKQWRVNNDNWGSK